MDAINFPFTIKHVFAGFAEVNGIIRLAGDTIELEFQTKDSIVKVIKTEVKNISIPITDIQEINFNKGMWENKLILRVTKLSLISELPSQEDGEIKLSIGNKYTEMAQDLVSKIKPEQKNKEKIKHNKSSQKR